MNLHPARKLGATMVALTLAVGLSCYPGEIQSLQELDLSIAIRNPDVPESAFGAVTSYAMPDTIIHVYPDTSERNPPELSRAYDEFILDLVNSHLQARGYQRVPLNVGSAPDVLVFVTASARTMSGAVWYPGYWWGGYWPPYGPCYYCYYPPVMTVYQWDQGSLQITMVDPSAPSDSTIAALWMGGVTGVLSSSSSGTRGRLETGINRVFDLSPYLRRN